MQIRNEPIQIPLFCRCGRGEQVPGPKYPDDLWPLKPKIFKNQFDVIKNIL